MEIKLNDNDRKLLEFCKGNPKSIREVAEHLNIARKNVFVKLDKLKKTKLINVIKLGVGKKTKIKTREDSKMKKYTYQILKSLNDSGGEMKLADFHKLNPFDFSEDGYDKFQSTLNVQYSPYVENIIKLSKKGEEFLKQNEHTN